MYAALLAFLFIVVPAQSVRSAERDRDFGTAQFPQWAFPVEVATDAPGDQDRGADDRPRRVPGSAESFTLSRILDHFNVADWHPDKHLPMPEIVARGRQPGVFACAYCHLPNGMGRPVNSSLAGLPADYIVQQIADFRNGLRRTSDLRLRPIVIMMTQETQASEAEIRAAAEYFAHLTPRRWFRVVETRIVPATRIEDWMRVPSTKGAVEQIGQRIIEIPEDPEQTALRNDAFGYVAFVPIGSLDRGKSLVSTGNAGKTVACSTCHGPDLRGMGRIPPLAGRSPSYLVRQLYDLQHGARKGEAALPMKRVVERLNDGDMLAIAAYIASMPP
jgi:cytochrome c553